MQRDPVPAVELRLRAAIDSAPSGILMTDADGRIVLVNRQIESTFGYSREDLLGKPVEILIPARLRPAHEVDRARFLREPAVRPMGAGRDLHGLHKDGTEIPLEIGLNPVPTETGMFVVATVVDIRARKRAEERFRIAVESSPNGMIMVDSDGRIVLVNREIERMFGYPRDEILGRPIEMLVPQRLRDEHPRHRASFHADPHRRSMGIGRDLFGVRKDGIEFPVEIGLNPIRSDEEGLLVLASVVDIGARKRAEQDRRRLEDQLREAQKMEAIGRLAGGIAHDFNNLLMGIHGCGELLRRMLPAENEGVPIVQDICDAAKRGASLTRDLLDFSRRKPADAVPSDLNAVVGVAGRMLRQVIGEDVELELALADEGTTVLANPTHLEHVLLNLAVNSRDAMPGGGRLRISTRPRRLSEPLATRGRTLAPGDYVVLEVEDSGSGMDEITQSRLFEPFFTTKAPGTGTGLGLYTVFSLVDQLEGGIDFESRLGHGTRFRIHFPRHASGLENAVPSARAAAAPVPSRSRALILVVEDERLIRTTLRHLLGLLGHDVRVADSGKSAVEVAGAATRPIDLVLSDVVLPDAAGPDVARSVLTLHPSARVLFMSAYPTDVLVQQGRVPPGTRTLEKPFDEQTLAQAVGEALASEPAAARQPTD